MMFDVIKMFVISEFKFKSYYCGKKLGFTKVVTKLNMSKKQNEPIKPLLTYHSGKCLLSKKNSDTKRYQRTVILI